MSTFTVLVGGGDAAAVAASAAADRSTATAAATPVRRLMSPRVAACWIRQRSASATSAIPKPSHRIIRAFVAGSITGTEIGS